MRKTKSDADAYDFEALWKLLYLGNDSGMEDRVISELLGHIAFPSA
jgi:hypothetical protein